MTRDRVIVAMLGAVAILLALNLLRGEPEAQAQNGPPFLDSAEPTVVSIVLALPNTNDNQRIYRGWSDGAVDMTYVKWGAVGSCDIVSTCGPVSIIPPP